MCSRFPLEIGGTLEMLGEGIPAHILLHTYVRCLCLSDLEYKQVCHVTVVSRRVDACLPRTICSDKPVGTRWDPSQPGCEVTSFWVWRLSSSPDGEVITHLKLGGLKPQEFTLSEFRRPDICNQFGAEIELLAGPCCPQRL